MSPNSPSPESVRHVVDGVRTLPLVLTHFRLKEKMPPFGEAKAVIEYPDPSYCFPSYKPQSDWLSRLANDPCTARHVVDKLPQHIWDFMYYVQFKDDCDRQRIAALDSHAKLVSLYCDAILHIDTKVLWEVFEGVYYFAQIHKKYREDPEREANDEKHCSKLRDLWGRISPQLKQARRLSDRICQVLDATCGEQGLSGTATGTKAKMPDAASQRQKLDVFYSYSHKDEEHREKLEAHLSQLKREGEISGWHDRKITGGSEWKGQIDDNLDRANIILLLISADFIASDYCIDIELKSAMEKHNRGAARVIPVILRACDWESSCFGKLQALPKDAMPVTSWPNVDEAFTDIAKGIRKVVAELRA